MNIPLNIARSLNELMQGKLIPASSLKHTCVKAMLDDGVLRRLQQGKGKAQIIAPNATALKQYLFNRFGISSLNEYIEVLTAVEISRSDTVKVTGQSKLRSVRTFKGFMVQTCGPVPATLMEKNVNIQPLPGSCWFIHEPEQFKPAPHVTIVGVENGENFLQIQSQKQLFESVTPLFVSRYPQSNDLIKWLVNIPNHYLHFGDFDFKGIDIFLNEFHRHIPGRSSFFIPANIELLLQQFGNRNLYVSQAPHVQKRLPLKELNELLDLFHQYKKVLEQEALINHPGS